MQYNYNHKCFNYENWKTDPKNRSQIADENFDNKCILYEECKNQAVYSMDPVGNLNSCAGHWHRKEKWFSFYKEFNKPSDNELKSLWGILYHIGCAISYGKTLPWYSFKRHVETHISNLPDLYPNNILIPMVFWSTIPGIQDNITILYEFQQWILKRENKRNYIQYLVQLSKLKLI